MSTFVGRVLSVAHGAIAGSAIEIARRVVTRLGLSVTQPGRDVAVLGSQAGLTPAHSRQLVRPGIEAVLGSVGAVFGRNPAVVDGLGAVVGCTGAPRSGLNAFVDGILAVACRAVPRGSVEIARRVVTRFRLSVAQPGRDITVLRGQPSFAAADTGQLVGPGILAVFRRLRSVLGCNLAVVDGLRAVVRSLVVGRRSSVAFARASTVARCPIPRGPVEVTCRVVTRFGLAVAQLGLAVTDVRSQIAVATLDVAIARSFEGVVAYIRAVAVLIRERHAAIGPRFISNRVPSEYVLATSVDSPA